MSNLLEIDRTKVCRTCLTYSEDMKSLYEAYLSTNQLSLAEILMAITPLKCYANDGLPTHICQSCTSSLTLFHIFQQKCIDTDQLLRDQLQTPQPPHFTTILIKSEPPDNPPPIKTEPNPLPDNESPNLTSKLYMALNNKPRINIPEIQKDLNKKLDMRPKTTLEMIKTPIEQPSEKPYACTVCSAKFDAKLQLKHHLLSHKDKKPFSCPLCTSSFLSQASLTIHKRKHTGEKPYACQVCERLFTQLGALNLHMRTHSATKRFVCKICGVGFNHKASLLSHMRKHVGEQIRAQFASQFNR